MGDEQWLVQFEWLDFFQVQSLVLDIGGWCHHDTETEQLSRNENEMRKSPKASKKWNFYGEVIAMKDARCGWVVSRQTPVLGRSQQ